MFKHLYANKTPKYVISTEQFSVTIASSSATGTATLTKRVNTATSFIVWGGQIASATNTENTLARLVLTDGVTVTATRDTASATTITVSGTVVYCSPQFVKSVQAGSVSITGAATTSTITAVRTDKTVVLANGFTTSNANANLTTSLARVSLTNSTTVTVNMNSVGTTCVVNYVAVEFQPDCVISVQQVAITAASGTSATATLATNVDVNNSLCFFGGQQAAGNTYAQMLSRIQLTNGTTVTANWNTSSIVTRTINVTVVNFAPKVIRSIRRGTTTITATTSATSTIDFVDVNMAWCMFLGFSCTGSSQSTTWSRVVLTNGTTITATLNSSGTDTVNWEVGWFN